MRKGAYAGPVTLGKHDETVKNAPSLRSRAIAGAVGGRSCTRSSAALSVSGRTPSAIMMMTGTSIHTGKSDCSESRRGSFTQTANRHSAQRPQLAGERPPEPDRLVRHHVSHARTLAALAMSHQFLNATTKQE